MTETTTAMPPPVIEEKKPIVTDDPKIGLALHDLDAKNAAAITTNPVPKEERNAETDAYITKQKEEKFEKRKKRGGVQERIDQLTKETAEAKKAAEDAKKDAEDARKSAEEAKAKPSTAAVVAEVASDKPDPRPKREDFTDEGEFTAKIAEWVVRQQSKIKPKAAEVAPAAVEAAPEEVKFDPANPEHAKLKADFDGFLETGREYIKTHPDFNDRLNDAAKRGLTLDNAAQRAIITLKSPEVLYYLASPENEAAARAIMKKTPVEQVVEIGLLYDKLQVKASDFVSSAGRPGIRLTNGNTRSTIPLSELDTDDYIRQRREDIKAGLRRRYR